MTPAQRGVVTAAALAVLLLGFYLVADAPQGAVLVLYVVFAAIGVGATLAFFLEDRK